jgi:leucyl-tRNA synthetase
MKSRIDRFASRMRRNKSWPEKKLWAKIKNKQLGVQFRSQVVLHGFIPDFLCKKLIVEVDGSCHDSRKEYDKNRDLILAGYGYKTLRFEAKAVMNNCPAVVAIIREELRKMDETERNKSVGRGGCS